MPPEFPKAKRLYVTLGDALPRLREWFEGFYGKAEMVEQVAVWGSAQPIADEIVRIKDAGIQQVRFRRGASNGASGQRGLESRVSIWAPPAPAAGEDHDKPANRRLGVA